MARLLIDMDGVLNDAITMLLARYNADYNDNLRIEDITAWELDKFVKPECGKMIYSYFREKGFFSKLPVQEHAQEVLARLLRAGHEIYVVTSSPPEAYEDKYYWFRRHFPFIPEQNIIFCTPKQITTGDVLFDDGPHNIKEWLKHNPGKIAIVMDAPWNRGLEEELETYQVDIYDEEGQYLYGNNISCDGNSNIIRVYNWLQFEKVVNHLFGKLSSLFVCLIGVEETGMASIINLLQEEEFWDPVATVATVPNTSPMTVTESEFSRMEAAGNVINKTVIDNGFSGILTDILDQCYNAGGIYYLICNTETARKLKEMYPGSVKSIFFYAPVEMVKEVLVEKYSSEEVINLKLQEYEQKLASAHECDWILNTEDSYHDRLAYAIKVLLTRNM